MIFKKTTLKRIDVQIENMCCPRCAQKVEGWLSMIEGVSAEVNYKKNRAVLLCKTDIPDEAIRSAVEQTGYYKVTAIERK